MKTKVFISWSGNESRELAEELKVWLSAVVQHVEVFLSINDIQKGKIWFSEILSKLQDTNFGICILTRENLTKPWVLFETGALAKNINEANVCTLLFNLTSADLEAPLSMFQDTKFDKQDVRKLLGSINDIGGENKLDEKSLDLSFRTLWPDFEAKMQKIMENYKNHQSKGPVREDREILDEILKHVRPRPFSGHFNPHLFGNEFQFARDGLRHRLHELNIPSHYDS